MTSPNNFCGISSDNHFKTNIFLSGCTHITQFCIKILMLGTMIGDSTIITGYCACDTQLFLDLSWSNEASFQSGQIIGPFIIDQSVNGQLYPNLSHSEWPILSKTYLWQFAEICFSQHVRRPVNYSSYYVSSQI